jgi:hypothetical protein
VHTQEWEIGIWHRVYEPSHELCPLGAQIVILTTKGHNSNTRLVTTETADAIRLKTGTVDQEPRSELSRRSLCQKTAVIVDNALHSSI